MNSPADAQVRTEYSPSMFQPYSFHYKCEYLTREASGIYLNEGCAWEDANTYHYIPTTEHCNSPKRNLPKCLYAHSNVCSLKTNWRIFSLENLRTWALQAICKENLGGGGRGHNVNIRLTFSKNKDQNKSKILTLEMVQ